MEEALRTLVGFYVQSVWDCTCQATMASTDGAPLWTILALFEFRDGSGSKNPKPDDSMRRRSQSLRGIDVGES